MGKWTSWAWFDKINGVSMVNLPTGEWRGWGPIRVSARGLYPRGTGSELPHHPFHDMEPKRPTTTAVREKGKIGQK